MENIRVTRIEVEATPGATLHHSLLEALAFAAKRMVDVTLIHNGKRYHFREAELRELLRTAESP